MAPALACAKESRQSGSLFASDDIHEAILAPSGQDATRIFGKILVAFAWTASATVSVNEASLPRLPLALQSATTS
jgi:hypothetical protein